MHKHKCDHCGNIWEHTRNPNWTSAQFDEAYTCNCCGARQTWKFYGEDHPDNPTPQEKRNVESFLNFMTALNELFGPPPKHH